MSMTDPDRDDGHHGTEQPDAQQPDAEQPHAGSSHTEQPDAGPFPAGSSHVEQNGAGQPDVEQPAPERVPVIEERQQEVVIERSVRFGRVIIGGAVVGVLVATLLALLTPLAADSEYTLGQIVGFMALIGAALGLGVGAIVALILARVARRRRGSGVAVQTDVR